MAASMPAFPQGSSVLSQTLAGSYCSVTELLYSRYRAMSACTLQTAALIHLTAIALAEFWPAKWAGSEQIAPVLIISGLALVLSALHSQRAQSAPLAFSAEPTETFGAVPAQATASSPLQEFALSPREIALERQSQRLVEIADTAIRSHDEAERRGQAWADLMSRVSHELRTPLNAVIGFSDVMGAEMFGPLGDDRYRDYIGHIRDSGRALLKSAEDTLALTALLAQPGSIANPEVLPLEAFAAEAWASVAPDGAHRNVSLSCSGLEGLDVLGERRPLRQILVNLFSAAIARAAVNSEIKLTARADGDMCELEVCVTRQCSSANSLTGALPISLARALLELQDTILVEMNQEATGWRAVTVLSVATQHDFFH